MQTAAADALIGTELGRYRIERVIGEGGMGRVYLGVQPAIGSRVAIKLLSDECARDPVLLERFFAEARAVNMIRHENIVAVIDLAQLPDGRPYIVMEYVEGQPLSQLIRAAPSAQPPIGGVVQVMREVLSALAAAHAIGIVHRDLKPDNIMVTVEGHAKVLDFGIAKLGPDMRDGNSPRTATGALLGTPAYMSPEQISGATTVDARTDVYAAGVVLFEAVTGRAPFAAATLFELMRLHLEQAPPSPRALRPELPDSIEHVILQALSKAPWERYADAGAMGQALHHASAALPSAEWRALSSRQSRPSHAPLHGAATVPARPQPLPTIPVTQAPRGHGALIAVLAVIALAIVAVVIVLVARGQHDEEVRVRYEIAPGAGVVIPAALPPASAPPREATHPLDYTPSHFDALAYLPTAKALARTLLPDADFTEFELYEDVWSDGHVDLTLPTSSTSYYELRSAAASARAGGHPKNMPQPRGCYVMVEVTATGARAWIRDDDACDHEFHAPPRCTLAQVWALAIADGEPHEDIVATIAYLHDGTWFFDADHAGAHPGTSKVHSYPDCR